MARSLHALLHDQAVGDLWAGGAGTTFALHPSYLDTPRRYVLGQWFEDRLNPRPRRLRRLHPWFDNLLPEVGSALRERYVQTLGIERDDGHALLSALGADLPGAVRMVETAPPLSRGAPINELTDGPLAGSRFSLAGMQLKFSLFGAPDRLSIGLTSDSGAPAQILKVGTAAFPNLAENEHTVMSWCRAAGFDVPETHVVDIHTLPQLGPLPAVPTAFLIRRSDRTLAGRVHQEDFAQVFNAPPTAKYDRTDAAGMMHATWQILGPSGAEELLRRLVVVVASGNADAHLKNWSLIYPDGVTPRWAPLYDQVATVAYRQVQPQLSLRIGTGRAFAEIAPSHLQFVANRPDIAPSRCDEIVEDTINQLAAHFDVVRALMPPLAERLRVHWREVPLLRSFALK